MSRISIGFLGNLYFDTRTTNLFHSLKSKGHTVFFNGFDWDTPNFRTVHQKTVRIQKLKKYRISIFYYFQFAFHLFMQLIRQRSDVYIASDFYSLPFCAFAARWWNSMLVYDSREIYTELPAFHDKPVLKKIVFFTEDFFIHKARFVLTTGDMDAQVLFKLYGIHNTVLLRNLPITQTISNAVDFSSKFHSPIRGKKLVYQGILVPGRGIETAFRVLQNLPEAGLVLLGEGAFNHHYQKLADVHGIGDRVLFAGKIPQQELLHYTAGADVGLSLIDNVCGNNFLSLPNKLFEYIMAGLPVIVSDLPQMKAVVEKYRIGAVVPENDADAVISVLQKWDKNPGLFHSLKRNCRKASRFLNWETEFEKAYDQIRPV